MSIVVFGSSSRIGQGIIRKLYNSGKYENILCADLFPTYTSVQRFLFFKQSLAESKTKISDIKVTEKSDLQKVLSASSGQIVYVTHFHFTNTASKLNLIQTTAGLSKELRKRLICVTPIELDHYGERDADVQAVASEQEARSVYPELNLVKSDLTFGPDGAVFSSLLFNIINGQSLTVKPSSANPAPVHAQTIADIVEQLINTNVQGEAYLAQGTKRVSWKSIIQTIESNTNYKAQINSDFLHTIASPLSNNLLSEYFFQECDRNLQQLINKYRIPDNTGLKDISSLGVENPDFQEFYKKNPINTQAFTWKDTPVERIIKRALF